METVATRVLDYAYPKVDSNPGKHRAVFYCRLLLRKSSVGLTISWLIWSAVDLQLQWNAAADVTAGVIAMDPSPPAPFANTYTIKYLDSHCDELQTVLGFMDIPSNPKLGHEVQILFLPESPSNPKEPSRRAITCSGDELQSVVSSTRNWFCVDLNKSKYCLSAYRSSEAITINVASR